MASFLVIKVNYEDMLRRFNADIDENGYLGIDIVELRAKICDLFNFSADDHFTLTYVDEDGDTVALVNDRDLSDVMSQRLKFLRIDVHLKNEKALKNCKSSGSSTPLRSPVQHPLQTINSGIFEALKSVPEPLCEALTNLSLDLTTKATSSSPVLAEILDCISKVGQLCVNLSSQTQLNSDAGPRENSLPRLETEYLNVSKNPSDPMEVPKHTGVASTSQTSQEVETGHSPPIPTFCDFSFLDHTVPDSSQPDFHTEVKSVGLEGFDSSGPATIGKSVPPVISLSAGNTECPFSGTPIGSLPTCSAAPHLPSVVPHCIFPAKGSNNNSDVMADVLHIGVECDECGANPISGPRYMSKWRYNYDICSSCFSKMGDEADYIKFVQPFNHSFPSKVQDIWTPGPSENSLFNGFGMHPRSKLDCRFVVDVNVTDETIMRPSTQFTKIWRMRNSGSIAWPRGTQIVWTGGDKFSIVDSVELEVPALGVPVDGEVDVAVDFIAPPYPGRYTSYWRMASPTGQKFGQRVWVLIQVHASPKDIDICSHSYGSNLYMPPKSSTAKNPENQYTSVQPVTNGDLPNLCTADNTQFVASEVDGDAKVHAPPKVDDIFAHNWGLNLTLAPCSSESKGPAIVDSCVQPVRDVSFSRPCTVNRATQPIKPTVEENSKDKGTKSFVIYPELSTSPVAPTNETNPFSNNAICSQAVNDNNSVEENLLKNLMEMGFTDIDLNKILRKNYHDLEQSLSALCTLVQWERTLNELEEMGFTDRERNRRLLRKNNGSIKLVVLDLLTGEGLMS